MYEGQIAVIGSILILIWLAFFGNHQKKNLKEK